MDSMACLVKHTPGKQLLIAFFSKPKIINVCLCLKSERCLLVLLLLKVFCNVQVGTIAGNLMLAHDHPDFPSDVFTIMEAVGATLLIGEKDIVYFKHRCSGYGV